MGEELINCKFKAGRTDQSAQTGTYTGIPFPHSQTLGLNHPVQRLVHFTPSLQVEFHIRLEPLQQHLQQI